MRMITSLALVRTGKLLSQLEFVNFSVKLSLTFPDTYYFIEYIQLKLFLHNLLVDLKSDIISRKSFATFLEF